MVTPVRILRPKKRIAATFLLCVVIFSLFSACTSMRRLKKHYAKTDKAVSKSNYLEAAALVKSEKEKSYKKRDRVLYYLNLGMLHHFAGKYAESNRLLTIAENAIETLFTKSISKAAVSLLLNDTVLDYSGEDYEDIYINVFKALNYLNMGNFDEAFVEVRRIDIKLSILENKYKKLSGGYNRSKDNITSIRPGRNRFFNDALGRYLSLLLYRAEGDFDNARIDMEKIREAFKNQKTAYNFPVPESINHNPEADSTKLTVLSFAGRIPDKKAFTVRITTLKNAIVLTVLNENKKFQNELKAFQALYFKGIKGGYNFKFQLPYIKPEGSKIDSIALIIDGEKVAELEKLESLENIALETFRVKKPVIYTKTIVRTIVKGVLAGTAANKASESMEKKYGNSGWLAGLATKILASVAVDISEKADLRMGHFFPAYAYVSEIEITPGIHSLSIDYYNKSGDLVFSDFKGNIEIKKGDLNLYESFYLR